MWLLGWPFAQRSRGASALATRGLPCYHGRARTSRPDQPGVVLENAMAKVRVSTTLQVPAQAVWNMIGGFNALARGHPAVTSSEEETENGARVTRLTLQGGGTVIERLERHDDKERTYSYSILESPLPVAGYTARLHVREAADGHSCMVEWSSEFDPSSAPESEAGKMIRGVYEAAFENLRKLFGG